MKNLLLAIALLFASANIANAFTINPQIDRCAIKRDSAFLGTSACSTTFSQGDGIAYQFSVDRDAIYNGFEVSMKQLNFDESQQENGWHNAVLYADTQETPNGVVPLNPLFSQRFDVPEEEGYDYHGSNIPEARLSPDQKYWLSLEGGTAWTQVEPKIRLTGADTMGSLSTPEPGTIALLGSGLGGLLLRRRKKEV